MKEELANAMMLFERAKDAMLAAIQGIVLEYGGEFDGGFISGNENQEWAVFDDDGDEVSLLQDLSADELYKICETLEVK